jgi:hypothetical protein
MVSDMHIIHSRMTLPDSLYEWLLQSGLTVMSIVVSAPICTILQVLIVAPAPALEAMPNNQGCVLFCRLCQ